MKAFKITLTQHSPACFANIRHSQNIYYTHDYIPGSVLWGAFIKMFLQSDGPNIHPDFFNDNLRFSNCYIVKIPDQSKSFAALPVPLSLYTCKTNPYSLQDGKKTGHELVDLLFRHRDNCHIETCQSALRPLPTGYIYGAGSGKPGLYRPNKRVEMHNCIAKATQNTRKEHGLFAYELLDEAGGIFSGEIQVLETSPLLEFIRDIKCRDLELGKARTSGCGVFTFNIEETTGSDRDCFFSPGFQDKLNLYCFSDVIIMDDFNRYQTVITPETLGLEQYIEMDKAFSRGFQVEGYNAKHNKPKINDVAILKGSCFSYRLKEGVGKGEAGREFIAQRLKHIEMNGLGMRLNEGFGRVRFNRHEIKEEDDDGTILENKKYRAPGISSKELYLDGFKKNWKMLSRQHIKSLPSYSALKGIFKDMHKLADHNLAEKKANFIRLLDEKTKKRRQQQWQHQDFAEKLTRRIREIDNATELNEWLGCFLEYYRLLKSESKND